MQDYAARFADILESTATRIRSMTVDRVDAGIRLVGLGIFALSLGLTALTFLLWAIFGALEIPLTTAGAFAVTGVLFVGAGSYLWIKRTSRK
ncbi:MAG: hypothetical protein ACE5F5_07535 [Acidimicrobiia bacterium]